ncbi:MAG: Gfo/Idh/MocA family oxidoreductase [Chloroflexota bacterium]
MTLGWGIVGLGRSAETLVTPAITADENSHLVAVVSRDSDKAAEFAARHGASSATTNFEAMLADPAVNVVAITSPNSLHPEQAIAAARAGKHVFCDKPLAPDVATAQQILDAAAAAGVKIGLNFQTRHHACFQEARKIIARGDIGEVVSVQVDASPGAVPLGGWRADQKLAGLGAVNNIAVHIHDLLRFLIGAEVTEVAAMFDTGQTGALERMPMILMRFANGALAYANGNQLTPKPLNDIVIHGSTGRIDGRGITRPGMEGDMRVTTATGETSNRYSSHDAYERTVHAFSQAILDGRDPNPSGLDGLRNVELSDAIRRSALEGRLIEIPG